jgi:hypothetical protein
MVEDYGTPLKYEIFGRRSRPSLFQNGMSLKEAS